MIKILRVLMKYGKKNQMYGQRNIILVFTIEMIS